MFYIFLFFRKGPGCRLIARVIYIRTYIHTYMLHSMYFVITYMGTVMMRYKSFDETPFSGLTITPRRRVNT